MELGLFVTPQQGATYGDQLAAARTAEAAGFRSFVRSDHYLANGNDIRPPGPTDTWITLAGLARETDTIGLGVMVSAATFRPPGLMSVIAAQVDDMADGRLIFGLGTGWNDREHQALGLDFPPLRERFDRLEEQLEVLTGLWSTSVGDTFTHHGRHYDLEGAPGLPKPHRRPHPHLVVGGLGAVRTPTLAARFADEFNLPPFQTPEQARVAFDRVRDRCTELGRPPESLSTSLTLTTFCGRDGSELERRAAVAPWDAARAALRGSPAEIVDALATFEATGATRAYLRVLDLTDLDHIELLAEALRPGG